MTLRARNALSRLFCWAGAALFLASLIVCFVSYETVMGRPADGTAAPLPSAIIDVALFSAFALHHSVFAREGVRQRVRALLAPGLERSFYVWIASLLLIAVCTLWQPVAGVLWQVSGPGAWFLRGIQLLGVWLTIRSAAAIDVLELAGVRPISAGMSTEAIEFKATGPYGWVRHPIYTGWLLIVFSEPTMTATRMVFAAVSGLYLLVAIPFEERSLRTTTAGAYQRYAARVPWKLIPRLY